MLQVQDRSIDMLTCSPSHSHYATAPPPKKKHLQTLKNNATRNRLFGSMSLHDFPSLANLFSSYGTRQGRVNTPPLISIRSCFIHSFVTGSNLLDKQHYSLLTTNINIPIQLLTFIFFPELHM